MAVKARAEITLAGVADGEQGPQGVQGPQGEKGETGSQGYGFVATVTRDGKTEAWWDTFGAIGHVEPWSNTEEIRNGCRIGDIFALVGTSTEGNSHVAYYRSTTDSGMLSGECISHTVTLRGEAGENGTASYGTCATAAGTAAKTSTISGFSLYTGATVAIKFTYANTASNPTLNVSSTGAKNIRMNNSNLSVSNSWCAGELVLFVYDGTYWVMQSPWKVLLATNGLTGTSNKQAYVDVGYSDAGATGDMRVHLYAFGSKDVSEIVVYPGYINFVTDVFRFNGSTIPAVETMTLNSTYGVTAWKNPFGVVTVASAGATAIPAGSRWSQVNFGTLPAGWRPENQVLLASRCAGVDGYMSVSTEGEVVWVRSTASTYADGLYCSMTFVASR